MLTVKYTSTDRTGCHATLLRFGNTYGPDLPRLRKVLSLRVSCLCAWSVPDPEVSISTCGLCLRDLEAYHEMIARNEIKAQKKKPEQ